MASVFSSGRPIQDESVTFVVDTNFLVEFQTMEHIEWKVLCPRAKSVRIAVPSTVIREMDNHKKSTGRLRKRALQFNKMLQLVEDGDGTITTLEGKNVELSLMLMERYPRDQLTKGELSFDSADDLIVAEAVRLGEDLSNVIFLSDDNNARRTARELRINVARPPEDWRRDEPKDQRDVRIAELERQLGALPGISLDLEKDGTKAIEFEKLQAKSVPKEFLDRLAQAILDRNPGIDRAELRRRHNLSTGGSRSTYGINPWSVTEEQVDRYCREYERYTERVMAWSKRLPETMNELNLVAPVVLQVSNEGEAFAQDVEVVLEASKGYNFGATDLIQSYLTAELEVPEPPTGVHEIANVPSIFEQQERLRRGEFDFYVRNGPDKDKAVSSISYECKRLRHGTAHVLSISLFVEENAPMGGELIVRASSASLADPVERKFPIKKRAEKAVVNYRSYFLRRLFFFPEDISSALSEALEEV